MEVGLAPPRSSSTHYRRRQHQYPSHPGIRGRSVAAKWLSWLSGSPPCWQRINPKGALRYCQLAPEGFGYDIVVEADMVPGIAAAAVACRAGSRSPPQDQSTMGSRATAGGRRLFACPLRPGTKPRHPRLPARETTRSALGVRAASGDVGRRQSLLVRG